MRPGNHRLVNDRRAKLAAEPLEGLKAREEATKFLKTLAGLVRLLERADTTDAFNQLRTIQTTTLANLIAFMEIYNIRFGAATRTSRRTDSMGIAGTTRRSTRSIAWLCRWSRGADGGTRAGGGQRRQGAIGRPGPFADHDRRAFPLRGGDPGGHRHGGGAASDRPARESAGALQGGARGVERKPWSTTHFPHMRRTPCRIASLRICNHTRGSRHF